jgi:hypothetical protein
VGWLDGHPWLGLLLIVVLPVSVCYWHTMLDAYGAAARSPGERHRILSPLAFPPQAATGAPYPARRLLERVEPAPFGVWLLPHLVQHDLTASQLAKRLGRSVAEVHAAVYGAPVGTRLPSVTLVDVICDALQLDRAEGRAAFFASVTELGSAARGGDRH